MNGVNLDIFKWLCSLYERYSTVQLPINKGTVCDVVFCSSNDLHT